MLSILIPTKNYECRNLVETLHRQGIALGRPFEIIVGEDGSSSRGLSLNAPLAQLPHCRIIVQPQNVGRSRIRNILAQEARGKNIFFIDSDAVAEQDNILRLYSQALEESSVVCGGLYHPETPLTSSCTLRHRYERAADKHRSAQERSRAPYDKFATFCFAIRRELFLDIKFDERITNYGYEDTIFGYELRERGVEIKHIDAPLMHIGLESNTIYLAKVEESLRTLSQLEGTIAPTALLRFYNRLKRWNLTNVTAGLWRIFHPMLRMNLLSKHPSLTLLNIYKIGYYCNLKESRIKE